MNFIQSLIISTFTVIGIMFTDSNKKIEWTNTYYHTSNDILQKESNFILNDSLKGSLTQEEIWDIQLLRGENQNVDRVLQTTHGGKFVAYKKDSVVQYYKQHTFKYDSTNWIILMKYFD